MLWKKTFIFGNIWFFVVFLSIKTARTPTIYLSNQFLFLFRQFYFTSPAKNSYLYYLCSYLLFSFYFSLNQSLKIWYISSLIFKSFSFPYKILPNFFSFAFNKGFLLYLFMRVDLNLVLIWFWISLIICFVFIYNKRDSIIVSLVFPVTRKYYFKSRIDFLIHFML